MSHPFLYGEDIKRYEKPQSNKYLSFPYEKDKDNSYKLITIDTIKEKYPLIYSYFKSVRDALFKRKIPINNNDFYKYSAAEV